MYNNRKKNVIFEGQDANTLQKNANDQLIYRDE